MILIRCDGSADARAAIETAGELLDRQPAIVVAVRHRRSIPRGCGLPQPQPSRG
jgi:hypothetical protein